MESSSDLYRFYRSVRQQTLFLTESLSPEDLAVQSMPEASPGKWHLGHTSWFFEAFILSPHYEGYRRFDDNYGYLFNSYYETVGNRHPRPDRGLLTRPGLSSVLQYRDHVDSFMQKLIAEQEGSLDTLVVTGLHHEMQHQELLLTDLLHLLSFNPLEPAVFPPTATAPEQNEAAPPCEMHTFEGGLVDLGAQEEGFSYDCERPRHKVHLPAYRMADRPVTNGEWLDFMKGGGYHDPLLWLADGWNVCQRNSWQAPLYWRQVDGHWYQFGLTGLQEINPAAPVCHISYYEADAYARWAGKRLPSEQEWEHGADDGAAEGIFMESARWRPVPAPPGSGLKQMYGDIWEWTSSPYMAYPGFKPENGALQEYNGKFMANQFVLRGGSCATPRLQMRRSYRNFFFPHHRWQFSGMRLAEDA